MNRIIMVAAIALLTAAPATAADIKTIACIEDGLEPEVIARIGRALVDSIHAETRGQGTINADTATMDADSTAMAQVAAACQGNFGWSDAALESAISYAMVRITMQGAGPDVAAAGLDTQKIAQVYGKLPMAVRSSFLKSPIPSESVNGLIARMSADGAPVTTDAQAEALGMYVSFMAVAEDAQNKFYRN